MKLRFELFVLLALLITACAPDQPPPDVTPSPPALTGTVNFGLPGDGALIYSEVLHLSGTSADLPSESFLLTLTGADEVQLAQTMVRPDADAWSVSLLYDRPAEPTEVTITALPVDRRVAGDYDTMTVVLAPLAHRSSGTYGTILSPVSDDVVGGDVIEIFGLVSGLPEQVLILSLRGDKGVIAQETLILDHPYALDVIPWQIELPTDGASGPVTLALAYRQPDSDEIITLHEVSLMLSLAAG